MFRVRGFFLLLINLQSFKLTLLPVAAFLFLILDYVFLLSTEVKYIWRYEYSFPYSSICSTLNFEYALRRSEFRLSKGLYLFSRYAPLCIHV